MARYGSMHGIFSVYASAEEAMYVSDWRKIENHKQAQYYTVTFEHKLDDLPSKLGVFFSAACSDDDPYIVVVRYSWGSFNPVEIEVNEKTLTLHMSRSLHLGGFWMPASWSSGRFYAYEEGCFKITMGVSALQSEPKGAAQGS